MKYLLSTTLLFVACVCTNAEDNQVSVHELFHARKLGRANSRYLQDIDRSGIATDAPEARVEFFETALRAVLIKSCLDCHGPETSEGRLRVDQLNADLLTGPDVEKWREVYNALSNSEMPPEAESEYALSDGDRGKIVDWLSGELNKASKVRRSRKEHTSFRRLTNYEYDYVLRDLLGVTYPVAKKLPTETVSEDGFRNSSELLQLSAMQFETYRDIALQALQRAVVTGERPEAVSYIVSMRQQLDQLLAGKDPKTFNVHDEANRNQRNRVHLLDRNTGIGIAFSNGKVLPGSAAEGNQIPESSNTVLVLPRSGELKLNLDRFLPDAGIMRVRIRAGRSNMNPDEYASLRLIFSAHTSNNANFSEVISVADIPVTASHETPEFIDFFISLSDIQRNPFRRLSTTFPRRDEFLHIRNISNAGGEEPLHVLIDHLEISAPFYEHWPPRTHTNLFVESENKDDEDAYAREVLKRFLTRVWGRLVSAKEVDAYVALFSSYRLDFATLEEAMIEVFATAMASPEFLYVTQRVADVNSDGQTDDGQACISDLELASRLGLFLWCSFPDEELLDLAIDGRLRNPEVLEQQVERMLSDARSKRFIRHFVQQWLGTDGLDHVTHISDEALKKAMLEEPIAFFGEVLRDNASIMDFIHSDYAVVNERLANHYRIKNVRGPQFRKVVIEPTVNRGGLLTNAAFLAMNSDGKDSHPLKRGVWMLERILNDPPPPPPPNVPEVDLTDPKILQMTLKERIADHRNHAACVSCHSRIDPWGIAFENYDALGGFRTRTNNQPVDATAKLFNQQTLAGMTGLKYHLLSERQDQFARAMVHKLTAYALGRPLTFRDHADIEILTQELRAQDDRLRDLVLLIVNSNIFNAK